MNVKNVFSTAGTVLALVAAAAGDLYAQAGQGGQPNPLIPFVIIFIILYFFMIRPQQKKAKEHQKMLNALKKDDRILTTGGIYGTVTAVRGEMLEVKIAEGVKIQLAKSAVGSVLTGDNQTVTPEVVKK